MKKQRESGYYTKAICIFVAAVAVCLAAFGYMTNKAIDRNSKYRTMNTVVRQSEHITTILEVHYQYLEGIAEELGKHDELITDDNMDMLASLRNYTDLELTALILPDGTAYYDNGQIKNVAHRRYFSESIAGERSLSDPLESSVDNEMRVILSVPVKKDGEVVGVLGGSYNVTALSHIMLNDAFDGIGYSLIVTKDGDIIAYDGEAAYQTVSYGENFYDFYNGKKLLNGDSLDSVKADFEEHRSGIVKMRPKNGGGYEQYLAYAPLEVNDWMICYVLPVSDAQQPYRFISRNETAFTGGFFIMVIILIAYIMVRNNKSKKALIRYARTDAMTGLYNKTATEECINELMSKEDGTHLHAFVIFDMDRFKHINDTYGHAFGDVVIKSFGALLKEHFRSQDIVGRIGGDEFVVFMTEVEAKENVCARIEQLIDRIHELKLPDFDERLTASIGIAYAPEAGDSYMDLYKNADLALYQTKQNGRDGYSVYER